MAAVSHHQSDEATNAFKLKEVIHIKHPDFAVYPARANRFLATKDIFGLPPRAVVEQAVKNGRPPLVIVLDDNGTMLDRVSTSMVSHELYQEGITVNRNKIFIRPHVEEFLRYCSDRNVAVIFASAHSRENVAWQLSAFEHVWRSQESVLSNSNFQFLMALGREECKVVMEEDLRTGKHEYSALKLLNMLWERYSGIIDPENTILVDNNTRYVRHGVQLQDVDGTMQVVQNNLNWVPIQSYEAGSDRDMCFVSLKHAVQNFLTEQGTKTFQQQMQAFDKFVNPFNSGLVKYAELDIPFVAATSNAAAA